MPKSCDLAKSPLFRGIHREDCHAMLSCFQSAVRTFQPDERVYDFSSDVVGVLDHGAADVVRIDAEGVSTVLESLGPGSVFGKTLAFAGSAEDSLEVRCREACGVLFLDFGQIFSRCGQACRHHDLLVLNMLRLTADKAQALSRRVDVLSRRTIREKLLCCFRQFSQEAGEGAGAGEGEGKKEEKNAFVLPFSLGMLADYIAADRSAMMREIKRLREEGVIRSDGRRFTLLRR